MKKTTCRDGVRVLMQYTDGVLPGSRRSAVEGHVGACRRCKGFVRSYAETPRILREATVTRMPERIGRRLHRMLVALPTPGRNRTRR